MANVVLKNITKRFGKKTILDNISLNIQDKEFNVLVGASGCGKSTLLRIIAGLEKPSFGEVFIDSKCVNNVEPKDRDIAMVFQSYALYPHMSVYENMAFGLKVRNVAECEIKRRVNNAAEILGLCDYLKSKPRELSGGQRQRVALGRAIVREPKVFLMDEPLSNLDAKLRVAMRSEIKRLHKKLDTTFVYVTHDQTEALTMGQKVVVLNNGVIQQVDSPYNVYNRPKNTFVASFMGSYPMDLFPATIEDGILNFGNIFLDLKSSCTVYPKNVKKVIVGVRMEDIQDRSYADFSFNLIKFKALPHFEESLGSKKIVYFNIGNNEAIASTSADYRFGNTIDFSIDPLKLKFFDANTKEAIC